ncbi:hypothetical protein Tco_0638483 [Tanacetum coccineum]
MKKLSDFNTYLNGPGQQIIGQGAANTVQEMLEHNLWGVVIEKQELLKHMSSEVIRMMLVLDMLMDVGIVWNSDSYMKDVVWKRPGGSAIGIDGHQRFKKKLVVSKGKQRVLRNFGFARGGCSWVESDLETPLFLEFITGDCELLPQNG